MEIVKEIEKEYKEKDVSIDELDLTLRPLNILKRGGVKTIKQLCDMTESELTSMRYMGRHSLEEIETALKEHGLHLRGIENPNTNKDNWTAIEDGLPPVGKPLIVTIQDHLQGNRKELRYPVYYEMDSMKLRYHWNFRFGEFVYELLQDVSEVIAWQELPQVYESER